MFVCDSNRTVFINMFLLFVAFILSAVLFYVKFIKPLSYWEKKAVVHEKSVPVLGVHQSVILGKKSLQETFQDIYKKYENESFVGLYQLNQPVLFVRDLDLIKEILVKNADNFNNRQGFFDFGQDPIFNKSLFLQNGTEWRDMRQTLSPSFTGNKMKSLFGLISDCGERFNESFLNKNENEKTVEAKELFSRITNDVIATCAFGVECNSIKDKDNEFYAMVKRLIGLSNLKFLFLSSCSTIVKMLKLPLIPKSVASYFSDIIKQTIKYREINNTVRPDMLQLLIEAKHKKVLCNDESKATISHHDTNHTITNDDIVPQAFIFFLGGFDTISTMCSYTAYELATNVDIQEKLQKEIDEALKKCNGKLTYEILMEMPYLDKVISESLRKWPPMDQIFRAAVKDQTIRGKNSKEVTLEPEIPIVISGYCIHRDPKYFPNPEKFDPERFSLENKSNIESFSYLPFGSGPRNCIGMRFSIMAGKVLFVNILSKFTFKVIEKTQIPLKIGKKSFTMSSERGIWLGIEKRQVI